MLGVSIPYQRMLILVGRGGDAGVVWFVLYRTRLGLAIRATANDLEVANLMGMNVHRVAMITVALSVSLAAVAGVVVAPVFVSIRSCGSRRWSRCSPSSCSAASAA